MKTNIYKKGSVYVYLVIIILILSLLFVSLISYLFFVNSITVSITHLKNKLDDYITIKSKEIYSILKEGYEYDFSDIDYLSDGTNIYEYLGIINKEIQINELVTISNITFTHIYDDDGIRIECNYDITVLPISGLLNYSYIGKSFTSSSYISIL